MSPFKSVLCTLKYKFSQLSQHEHGESHDMQAFKRLRQLLVVPRQATKPRHPALTTLHNPAPWQQHKAATGLRALDDFELYVVGSSILSRLLTCVGLVDKGQFHRIARSLLHLFGQFGYLLALLLVG